MSTTEILVMAVFGALVVGAVAMGVIQARRSHIDAVRYAETRGAPPIGALAGDGVLVASSWAQPKEEWDHLVALATRLRDAVR